MVLRSSRVVQKKLWCGVDMRDFGDVIYMMGERYDNDEQGRKRYVKQKGSKKDDLRDQFDVTAVTEWVRRNNAEIARKIAARLHQEFDMT